MLQDILFIIVGIGVGVMNAVAGGGMLLGFPILLAAGVPPITANATTGLMVLPGQIASVYGYRRYLRKISAHYLFFLVPCGIGGMIGAFMLRQTSPSHFADLVPALMLFAVVLFAFQPLLHFHIHQYTHVPPKYHSLQRLLITCAALLPIGIYGGYFGAGFGFLMLAFLGFTSLRDTHKMSGLKNMAGLTIALSALLTLLGSHLINWHVGLFVAAGNLIGGYYGALWAQKVSNHTMRTIVIAIGLTAAAYLAMRTY